MIFLLRLVNDSWTGFRLGKLGDLSLSVDIVRSVF